MTDNTKAGAVPTSPGPGGSVTVTDMTTPGGVEVHLRHRAGAKGQGSPCPLCGEPAHYPVAFQITDTTGKPLCEDCVEKHFTPGHWDLLEGLDQIDTALFRATEEQRPGMGAFAMKLLGLAIEAWAPRTGAETADN